MSAFQLATFHFVAKAAKIEILNNKLYAIKKWIGNSINGIVLVKGKKLNSFHTVIYKVV